MGQFIQRTTLRQCENLTIDLLKEKLNIDESEGQDIINFLEAENVVVKKYIFQCNKCGEMNTVASGEIAENGVCQICEGKINIKSCIAGAEVRYILDRNNFMELMDEEGIVIPKESSNIPTKTKLLLFETVKNLEEREIIKKSENMKKESNAQLFISHATADGPYIEAFVKFLEELGFDERSMFCSSVEGYGMKWGSKIYDYLADKFNNEDNELMVLFMLSDNYYDSAACLNEMGAAWVLKKDYRSILLPGFEFKDIVGAIDPREMAIKLDDKRLMTQLNDVKDQLTGIFELRDISSTKWDKVREELINKVNKIKSGE